MNNSSQKNPASALTVAKFFLSLDSQREYFVNEKMVKVNGLSVPTSGNLRLNKLLQIAQILYCAKQGEYLFPEKFMAFEHGGIVYEVYRQFHFLVNGQNHSVESLPAPLKDFLTKIFNYFKTYSNQQLEDFVHEDPAWFSIWEEEDSHAQKEMPHNQQMINYYRKFASHLTEKINL